MRGLTKRVSSALSHKDPWASLIREPCPGVFVFYAFTRSFCRDLLAEVDKHEPESPNSMNKYGLVLKDVGMGDVCEEFLHELVNPLVRRFYPRFGAFKDYHGFIVNYDPKKQGSLDRHSDSSQVTLNICLGREFTGGNLVFRNDKGKPEAEVEHHVGQAILHLGSHIHQAKSLKTGKRSNLILWCQS